MKYSPSFFAVISMTLGLWVQSTSAQDSTQIGASRYVTIFDDFANITIQDPKTYGEFRPRLSGALTNISLRAGPTQASWQGYKSDFGVLQAWGAPFVSISDASGISEIDYILRRFMSENRDAFQVSAQDVMIDMKRTKFSGYFKYITYQRIHRVEGYAYPIENAFITFRFKFNRLIAITNFSFGEVGELEAPTISMQDAFETVIGDIGFNHQQDKLVGKVVAEIQPYYSERSKLGFRFVYRMQIYKDNPNGLWEYLVGARDGRIVQLVSNLRTTGHVSAGVFPRKIGDELVDAPLTEIIVKNSAGSVKTDLAGNYNLDGDNFVSELSGTRVNIRESGRRSVEARSEGDGNIVFSPQSFLSETMAYVHISRVNAFVRNFISAAPRDPAHPKDDFLNLPLTVNTRAANAQIKSCNAWFDPQKLSLNFLEADAKCQGSAHFSDIIYHEWGHGLDDALGGIQDGAFSEGVGDIVSALMTGDSQIAPGFIKGTDKPIRNIDGVRVYPRDRARDPHIEALIISGAWFEVLQRLKKHYGPEQGRVKTSEIFFKHLVSTDSYLDSYLGALAIDDDDGNLSNCTPHMCFFNIAFARRGLVAADPRCMSQLDGTVTPACADSTIKPGVID